MPNLKLTPTQNQNQAGYSGYGSLLTVSEDKGITGDFPGTLMGALMGINAINIRTNVIPSYHMRSLGRFQSFSPGLRDGGEVSAAVNWLPGMNDTQGRGTGTWSLLRQATLESNALTRLRIFAPDPDLHMVTTEGFLTQLGPLSYQPEAIMSGQVGWKIVGSPDIVTPIVFRVSGGTPGTAGSQTLVITRINGGGQSDTGSIAAGILIGSGYNRNATAVLAMNNSGSEELTVTLSNVPTAAQAGSELRCRVVIPGEYECWTPRMNVTGGSAIAPSAVASFGIDQAGAADTDDRDAFINRWTALNGPDFFLAVYGAAEL